MRNNTLVLLHGSLATKVTSACQACRQALLLAQMSGMLSAVGLCQQMKSSPYGED